MRVLGRADDDGIEFTGPVIDPAVVSFATSMGVGHRRPVDCRFEHVTECDDVLGADIMEVRPSSTADADHGDVELLVEVPAAEEGRSREGSEGRAREGPRELPAGRLTLTG
jgi:hypothetical protein